MPPFQMGIDVLTSSIRTRLTLLVLEFGRVLLLAAGPGYPLQFLNPPTAGSPPAGSCGISASIPCAAQADSPLLRNSLIFIAVRIPCACLNIRIHYKLQGYSQLWKK
jgi:hypothetical protein